MIQKTVQTLRKTEKTSQTTGKKATVWPRQAREPALYRGGGGSRGNEAQVEHIRTIRQVNDSRRNSSKETKKKKKAKRLTSIKESWYSKEFFFNILTSSASKILGKNWWT